jgi:BASS family bile acid:Na+ symporter
MALRTFIDRYALIIAMILGALGYKWLTHLNGLTSPLIFLMLFFTFCKINPLDLRLRTWHWLVLAAQLTLTAILFWAFYALSPNGFSASSPSTSIAQSIILCVLMPTATAAPIIAGKLGGSIQNLTTFSLLSNFATAIIVPALFPIINPSADIAFLPAMWQILCRVTPLLLGPFIAAWILRLSFDTYYRGRGMSQRFQLKGIWASMPFYLWIVLLIVLMARITHTLVSQEYAWITIVILCVGALVACLLQFALGRWIGYHFPAKSHGVDYQDILINPAAANYSIEQKSRITAGQAFGQKNTALGIWLAQMYLNPLAAIGPAAYILWQNLLNSFQLWHAGKAKN